MNKYPKEVISPIDRDTYKADTPVKLVKGWRVNYIDFACSPPYRGGHINLPDGWQDMDRTWTAQDICWINRFDCKNVHGRAMLI